MGNKFRPNIEPPPDSDAQNDKINNTYSEGKYTFENRWDVQLKINFLTLVTKTNNGDILAIRVPLVSISESVDIANRFILIIGGVIILLGSLWAFWFSKRFTKPILELNSIAQNMANSILVKNAI